MTNETHERVVFKVDDDRLAKKVEGEKMRHQLFKGLMMALLVAGTLAFAVESTNAQSSRRVTANVPFDFVVGDKTFASGAYEVRSATSAGGAMIVKNEASQRSITRLTNSIQPINKKTTPRLVFHKYGETYFLAEVWSGGDYAGRQLLESKREKQLRRESPTLAQNQFERVELVAVMQ
jgi:hypothetical protein